MKKGLIWLLMVCIILSVAVVPVSAFTNLINNCDSISGWEGIPNYDTTCSIDTVKKVEGSGSIAITTTCGVPESPYVRAMAYLRLPEYFDLTDALNVTLRLYVSRAMAGQSNTFQINLVSSSESQDGMNFDVDISNYSAGWHNITLNMNSPSVTVPGTDKSRIRLMRFTWFNYSGGETASFNIDDICTEIGTNGLSSYTPTTQSDLKFGDIDSNGSVTAVDALYALRFSVGRISNFTKRQKAVCDVNGDETISAVDALEILQYSVEIVNSFIGEKRFYKSVDEAVIQDSGLKFDQSGNFKILQMSDLHINENGRLFREEVLLMIDSLLERTKPNFAMLAGDIIMSGYSGDHAYQYESVQMALEQINTVFAEHNVPFGVVMGNHDDVECGLSNDEQVAIYSSLSHCVSGAGKVFLDPYSISNRVGNYVIPVKSSDGSRVAFNIWGVDTGENVSRNYESAGLTPESNAFILTSQINWFVSTSDKLEAMNNANVPGFMFAHVPLPEFLEIKNNPTLYGMTGISDEGVACSSHNSGMFSAMKAQGNILGYFCGHDHWNNFSGKYQGIELAFDGSLAYDSYGGYYPTDSGNLGNTALAGGRLLTINQNNISGYSSQFISYQDAIPYINVPDTVKLGAGESFEMNLYYAGCSYYDTWFGIYPASYTTYLGNSFGCWGYFASGVQGGISEADGAPGDGVCKINSSNILSGEHSSRGTFEIGEQYQIVMFRHDRASLGDPYDVVTKDVFTFVE